jgi:predicted MFS family arabinose efflux permease
VSLRGQGLAYGMKQSAPAVAIMLGGLAVPAVGLVLGWRWTFGFVAVLSLMIAAASLRGRSPAMARTQVVLGQESAPRSALSVAAMATMLGSSAAVSLAAFLPNWANHLGLSTADSGLLLSAGGGLALIVRLGSGFAADRRVGRHMPVVTGHLAIGAVGLVLLSLENAPIGVAMAGALVAFGIGWGWPGLLLFAVVRIGRDAPGAAAGAIQGGNFAGAAVGPIAFGYLAATTSYPLAWRTAAAIMLFAAVLLLIASHMFIASGCRRMSKGSGGHNGET